MNRICALLLLLCCWTVPAHALGLVASVDRNQLNSGETVELTLHDQLEDLPAEAAVDREIMSALLRIVRMSRRMNTALKEEILFVAAERPADA